MDFSETWWEAEKCNSEESELLMGIWMKWQMCNVDLMMPAEEKDGRQLRGQFTTSTVAAWQNQKLSSNTFFKSSSYLCYTKV